MLQQICKEENKMVRRYLQRKNIKDTSKDDKFASNVSSNLDVKDIPNMDERQIILDDKMRPRTPFEKVQIETRNALDKAGNVGQYVKYVNHYIERKNSDVKKIQERKKAFDKEVELLKSTNDSINNSGYNLPKLNNEDLSELKKSLVIEQTKQKIYLNKLKEQIWDAEATVQKLDQEIKQLDRQISSPPADEDESTKLIKERMSVLSKKYDTKTITEILDALESSLE